MKHTKKELQNAVETVYYTGMKASELATLEIPGGEQNTLLHMAARNGHLPTGTTAEDLTTVKNKNGVTPLHVAAYHNTLPANASIQTLSQTKDNNDTSALFHACYDYINGEEKMPSILKRTTLTDLLQDTNKGIPLLKRIAEAKQETTIQKNLFQTLLNNTQCDDPKQIKSIAQNTSKICPIETALWTAQQISKTNAPSQ